MQTVHSGFRSLNLIVDLNLDRVLYAGAILVSLGAASWLVSFGL